MEDPINANPTIIDVADLPTRQTKEPSRGSHEQLMDRILSLSLLPPKRSSEITPTDALPDLVSDTGSSTEDDDEMEDEEEDPVDSQEIFDLIATISDPEHPLTLAQLAVVNLEDIDVIDKPKDQISEVLIKITPTITHCSLATLIGLGIRVRLDRCLPPRFRIRILIKEGTHQSENQVNKQLNDKERVAAACENDQLLSVISQMLSTCKSV
ncbi:MIP18 family protein YHR122W [[Candida] anglica]|uniref:MIP18 family protein YHR122W n=1 Tax=[Candida] anglica TaxID=148631 RepID=A0ABP0EN28_9ASCO